MPEVRLSLRTLKEISDATPDGVNLRVNVEKRLEEEGFDLSRPHTAETQFDDPLGILYTQEEDSDAKAPTQA